MRAPNSNEELSFDHYHDGCNEERCEEGSRTLLSFVVPVKDEEESLVDLHKGIAASVPVNYDYELVFVDDGSEDESWAVIQALCDVYPEQVRGIRFRNNVGKAAGLTAGFRAARGEIVFTMDADLQDDPKEIPRFLSKLAEGYDVVSGYKKVRHDPWHKVLPSRVFNWMLSRASNVQLHDHNCGFKCYRSEVLEQMTLYGELHRMVPSLAGMRGFRVTEIVVTHHARVHGQSKYGVERFIRGFSDMLTIGFLKRYRERPSHFVNAISFVYLQISAILAVGGIYTGVTSLQGSLLVLFALVFAGMAGSVFLCGLLSEQIVRGGNVVDWQLPIVEDTAVDEWYARKERSLRSVPTNYSSPKVLAKQIIA